MDPSLHAHPGHSLTCDVLVIGGGAAGLAATVAAARAGAQVVLLERYGFLGGLATAGLVGTVCGLYLRDAAGASPTPVAGGFTREFAARLAEASDREPLKLEDGLWVLPYAPWDFERLADTLVHESPHTQAILHATLTSMEITREDRIHARALAWNETLEISAAAAIDCTGEATASAMCNLATEEGLTDQTPALIFVMESVDPGFAERGLLDMLRSLRRAVEQGQLPEGCERVSLVPGTGRGGRVAFKLNMTAATPGQAAWAQVTRWERQGRALADAIQAFLVEHVAAFRHARLARAATQLGVRGGRRILGQATLADEDVLECRKFPDGIARGGWPMERWDHGPRPSMTFFAERDTYEIPAGCLCPVGARNVFAAGRCISATPGAMASARAIGTALATGWAAGALAAAQAAGQPREEAIRPIREQMEG